MSYTFLKFHRDFSKCVKKKSNNHFFYLESLKKHSAYQFDNQLVQKIQHDKKDQKIDGNINSLSKISEETET